MITLDYHCDETGQKMRLTIAGIEQEGLEAKIEFEPSIGDDTRDPGGLLSLILRHLKGRMIAQ